MTKKLNKDESLLEKDVKSTKKMLKRLNPKRATRKNAIDVLENMADFTEAASEELGDDKK